MGLLTNLLSKKEEEPRLELTAQQKAQQNAVDNNLAPGTEDDFETPQQDQTSKWITMLKQLYGHR